MSLSDNYPDIRPVWMNDYSNAGVIDPRCVFTRSDSTPSNVHYYSSEDHLSSENLIAYSSDISNSYWTKQGVSPTGGQTAPDGGTDAYKLTENASTSDHRIYHLFGPTPTDETTITFYVKYIGRQWVYVRAKDVGGTNRYCWFDIQNGLVGTVQTNVTASIASSGNGYYKCTVVLASAIASGQSLNIGGAAADGDGAGYAGLNGDAFALWGINMSTLGETTLNETSGQIHREYAATLKSVAYSGQPRFEYEPTGDRSARGLLIESSSSNLIARSYEIDNAYWSKQNTTVTAAAAVGVTGALNACLVTEIEDVSPATSVHSVYSSSFGLSSATSCTFSVYCKAAGVNRVQLLSTVGGSVRNAIFNIANGTVVSESSATGAVESVGNGFYRISLTYTAPSTTNGRAYLILLNDSDASDYAGNGYNSVIASAFQFEQNALPSSYIATSGSASTRTRDQLSVATADIGFEGGPLTLVADSTTETDTLNPVTFHVYKNGDHQISLNAKSDNNRAAYIEADNSYSILTSPAVGNGVRALRVDTNDIATALNGTIDATDTSQTLPDLTGATMYIGDDSNGGNSIDGHIKRVAIFSEALSDTELQALTS